MPMRRAVLMMRQAISPRLAIRILSNMGPRAARFGGPTAPLRQTPLPRYRTCRVREAGPARSLRPRSVQAATLSAGLALPAGAVLCAAQGESEQRLVGVLRLLDDLEGDPQRGLGRPVGRERGGEPARISASCSRSGARSRPRSPRRETRASAQDPSAGTSRSRASSISASSRQMRPPPGCARSTFTSSAAMCLFSITRSTNARREDLIIWSTPPGFWFAGSSSVMVTFA